MSKKKLTLKIDEEIKERAKQEFNISQTVEEHLRDLIAGPNTKKDRIEQINEKIEEHKDVISERQRKISNLQSEKKILEKKMEEEAKTDSNKVKFFRIAKRKIGSSWNSPEDIPVYWRSKFDESMQELWQLAKNSDADPVKKKKVDDSDFDSAEVTSTK